jgi:hypothetical protein
VTGGPAIGDIGLVAIEFMGISGSNWLFIPNDDFDLQDAVARTGHNRKRKKKQNVGKGGDRASVTIIHCIKCKILY